MQQIILKLQFLGDSKKVNLPINSSLMPSPKVSAPNALRSSPCLWFYRQLLPLGGAARSISLKFPYGEKESLVNVINHPYVLFLYVTFDNAFLQIDFNFLQ